MLDLILESIHNHKHILSNVHSKESPNTQIELRSVVYSVAEKLKDDLHQAST